MKRDGAEEGSGLIKMREDLQIRRGECFLKKKKILASEGFAE
jgi:hypothetical protein